MTINKIRKWFDDSYDLYINQICLELMFITASMTRYQRTFEQQMKKKTNQSQEYVNEKNQACDRCEFYDARYKYADRSWFVLHRCWRSVFEEINRWEIDITDKRW
jgi:hypothetical protein